MIFAISREFSQAPAWFYTLDHGEQTLLLADWRERHQQPQKKKPKRRPVSLGKDASPPARAFWLQE